MGKELIIALCQQPQKTQLTTTISVKKTTDKNQPTHSWTAGNKIPAVFDTRRQENRFPGEHNDILFHGDYSGISTLGVTGCRPRWQGCAQAQQAMRGGNKWLVEGRRRTLKELVYRIKTNISRITKHISNPFKIQHSMWHYILYHYYVFIASNTKHQTWKTRT